MTDINQIAEAVIDGDIAGAAALVKEAIEEGKNPSEILNRGLIAGMDKVGEYFRTNEFYVPEVLMAANAMKNAMNILKPKLIETGEKAKGTVAIGTVKGDQHDIGKNLVAMMLEGSGFEVTDLGVDVKPEKFAEAAEKGADIIGMSALLTTTMPGMKKVTDLLKEKNLRDKVKIIVGGAPVTQSFADEIDADAYASDAADAVLKAKLLLK